MPKTTYMWDELSDNVAAEYEDGVLAVGYTHEPGLYGNLLSQNRNGVTSYYHYDGRGDTVALTDDSGNVTDTKEYDAWGNVIASTGSTVTPFEFCGRQGYQSSVTRFYVRARHYSPRIAAWMSLDPILPPTGMAYIYASNSPIQLSDPSGLFPCTYAHKPCGVFSGITLVDAKDPKEAGTGLTAYWSGGEECNGLGCRCREVGFVQTVKYDYVYDTKYGFGMHYTCDWRVDTARGGTFWPYSFKATMGSSKVDPRGKRVLSMTDSPGVAKFHALGHRLLSLEHSFETCVTCLSIDYPYFDDGRAVPIHTLGCFTWSYTYLFNPSPRPGDVTESLTRYLSAGRQRKHTSKSSVELKFKGHSADQPSEAWKATVCKGLQELTRNVPGDPD